MEGLDFILDDAEVNALFEDINEENSEETSEEQSKEQSKENKDNKNTADVNPEEVFSDSQESVGSEDTKDNGEDSSSVEEGTSPDFFSSIATAFIEEGIFPDLDEQEAKEIKTAADLRAAIDKQIRAGLDEQLRRIVEALDNNVEPNKIRLYEGVLSYLNSISEDAISEEGERGEELRKRILFQDYINRGFSKERAEKAITRAFADGTDIEDAKEALESNKSFFGEEYLALLDEARDLHNQYKEAIKALAERLKKTILDDNSKFFGDIEIDKSTRQAAYDAISKPVYKDPKTGLTYTAVQKLELEDSTEFLAKLGLLYAVTNGFKSIDGLVNSKVKKEMKKGFRDLESKIINNSRNFGGNLRYTSGVSSEEALLGKGAKFDL